MRKHIVLFSLYYFLSIIMIGSLVMLAILLQKMGLEVVLWSANTKFNVAVYSVSSFEMPLTCFSHKTISFRS